jgi:hypothetical protein
LTTTVFGAAGRGAECVAAVSGRAASTVAETGRTGVGVGGAAAKVLRVEEEDHAV